MELEERVEAFNDASCALRAVIERWSQPGVFVVADTSFYIHHPDKLDDLDLAPLIGACGDDIHVLVPIVVVDELDGLKQSNKNETRSRARQTLAVLDRVFAHTTTVARLRDADFSALGSGGVPRGLITVELVFDPPGHVRLPINDDEIIDRVRAIQPLAGRLIKLLTYDTGQSTRARAVGLDTIKLVQQR
ncbi:MAG: PIN domain-containing protein [Actinomycetia bacterium]|nr:PIN domain-containing protein [Actinomycetes bacterium]